MRASPGEDWWPYLSVDPKAYGGRDKPRPADVVAAVPDRAPDNADLANWVCWKGPATRDCRDLANRVNVMALLNVLCTARRRGAGGASTDPAVAATSTCS